MERQSATGVGRGSESKVGFGRRAVIETGIGLCVTIELDVDTASTRLFASNNSFLDLASTLGARRGSISRGS